MENMSEFSVLNKSTTASFLTVFGVSEGKRISIEGNMEDDRIRSGHFISYHNPAASERL